MPYAVITLSSVGTSPIANMNWRGGSPVSGIVTSSAVTSSADFIIQYSLDDPQLVSSSLAVWVSLSSNPAVINSTLSALHYSASAAFPSGSSAAPDCVSFSIPGPVAALRLSSSSIAAGTNLFFRLIQGEAW
jgi:hypothetical protein